MKLKVFALLALFPSLTYSMEQADRLAYYSAYVQNVTQILSPIECWHFMKGMLRHPEIDCINKPGYERCQEYDAWLTYLSENSMKFTAIKIQEITEWAANQREMPMLKSLADENKCCIASHEETDPLYPFILGTLCGVAGTYCTYKAITWVKQRYYYQQKQHNS